MNKIIEGVNHAPVAAKAALDIGAVSLAWVSMLTDHLPQLASLLSVIWLSLQIYAFFATKRWKRK